MVVLGGVKVKVGAPPDRKFSVRTGGSSLP